MFDHTVTVKLKRVSDNTYVGNHEYSTGAVNDYVQITGKTPEYQTHFKRGDIGAIGPVAYVAEVWFLNVDGLATLQATSNQVTF